MAVFDEIMRIVHQVDHLGSRKLASGVQLVGRVPHVAPEAYFHVIFPALDDLQIQQIEREIGRRLPCELRDFYRYFDGISLFAYSLAIYGLRHSYVREGDEVWQPFSIDTPNVFERPAGSPDSLVFFGGYRSDGSLLGMTPQSPVVYRFAPHSVMVLNEWPSVDEMLLSEVDRLSRLFDQNGRKIDEEAPTTPPDD